MPRPRRTEQPASAAVSIDTGWPFLFCALLLLACTVLIPAFEDLEYVRWQRDRALALEAHRFDRTMAYERYLAALDRRDPGLIRALALTQLNAVPETRTVLVAVSLTGPASIFADLEPGPVRLPERVETRSILKSLTTSQWARPWLIGLGAVLLFIGLTPPAQPRG